MFEGLGNAADGSRLIETFCYRTVDLGLSQRFSAAAALDEELQFGFFVEALYLAGRVAGIIPKPVFVTVGVEDYRSAPKLCFEAIGIQFRLLLADARIAAGTLGLHQSQGLPSSPQST